MSWRRGLETLKDLASEGKEGIQSGELRKADTMAKTCLLHAGTNEDQEIKQVPLESLMAENDWGARVLAGALILASIRLTTTWTTSVLNHITEQKALIASYQGASSKVNKVISKGLPPDLE